MAIANMGFTGTIGDLIYYKVGDKTYVRAKPSRVRQTKSTKASAGEFGRASSLGAAIRKVLGKVIPDPADNKMQTRLVSMLFQWLSSGKNSGDHLKNLSCFRSFSFDGTSRKTVRDRWKIALQIRVSAPGMIELIIPEFRPLESIIAPSHTVKILCRIAVGACDMTNNRGTGSFYTELQFQYNDTLVEEQRIAMKLPAAKGSLVVTGISLLYILSKNGDEHYNSNKAYLA